MDDSTLPIDLHILLWRFPDGGNFRVAEDVCLYTRYKVHVLQLHTGQRVRSVTGYDTVADISRVTWRKS